MDLIFKQDFTNTFDGINCVIREDDIIVATFNMNTMAGRAALGMFCNATSKDGGTVYNSNSEQYDIGSLDQLLKGKV